MCIRDRNYGKNLKEYKEDENVQVETEFNFKQESEEIDVYKRQMYELQYMEILINDKEKRGM